MKPGTRVRVLGKPYAGRVGVVVDAPNPSDRSRWPVWVHLDGHDHAVGFDQHEVTEP